MTSQTTTISTENTGIKSKAQLFSDLVRPVTTLLFSAASIGLAYAWTQGADGAKEAFAALAPFTMMIITFWFKDDLP